MGGNWWTGLTDKENESNWKWPHSQKMAVYTSWKSGQPNGAINSRGASINYVSRRGARLVSQMLMLLHKLM